VIAGNHPTAAPAAGATQPRRLFGLQYLRALAALAVLLDHGLRATAMPLGLLGTGVDLFFVLSGFLMVAITDERTRPWPFLKARIVRIVPLYWIMSLGVFVLIFGHISTRTLIPFRDFGTYYTDIPWRYVLASFSFVPWEDPTMHQIMPLISAGWTLNLEMMFYALFALTLFLPRRHQLAALTVILASFVFIGLACPLQWPPLRGWTNPIVLEFVAGAWLGHAWQRKARLWPIFGAILLIWIPLSMLSSVGYASPRSLLNVILFAPHVGVLVLTLWAERRRGGVPDWPALRMLGDASYSIYLWQFIPVLVFQYVETRFGTPSWVYFGGVVVIGLLGGIIVHHLLERPLLASFGRSARYRHGVPIPGGV
jgi:exopolysaccharide production protein ExoZ